MHHYGQGHGKGSLKPSSTSTTSTSSSGRASKPGEDASGAAADLVDSDDDDLLDETTVAEGTVAAGVGVQGAQPPLQRVAGQTARTARAQQKRAQEIEQAEQAHQSLVSKGATLAGVVVGGVVIGALTAGVGLVPYLGLVGTAAVVSGGAVAYTAAQAPSSRVLLAAETEVRSVLGCGSLALGKEAWVGIRECVHLHKHWSRPVRFITIPIKRTSQSEALRWKGALELQVAVLEGRRPPPPPEIDLQVRAYTEYV